MSSPYTKAYLHSACILYPEKDKSVAASAARRAGHGALRSAYSGAACPADRPRAGHHRPAAVPPQAGGPVPSLALIAIPFRSASIRCGIQDGGLGGSTLRAHPDRCLTFGRVPLKSSGQRSLTEPGLG